MRRQILAAALSAFIGPIRPRQSTMLQQIATIKDIPPVIVIRPDDRLTLSQGLFTGSVTINRLFSSAPVVAANTTFARSMGDRLADYVNAKDYGAMLDGKADDTAAIQAATAAAAGNPVLLPAGTAATQALPDFMTGRFTGNGQLLTGDGHRRARMFARRATEPVRYGILGDISTAFDGDMSTVQLAIEHRIDGASTLTKPTQGYVFHHENSAISLYYQNKSGYNALSGDQGGRTGCAAISGRVTQEGQGDATMLAVTGTVFGTNPSSTHFLANPAVLVMDGDLFGFADGTYQQVDEFSHNDYGYDLAVSSTVRNFYRTNAKGAKGAWWLGLRYQSFGAQPVDVAFQLVGKWNNVLDTTRASTGPSNAVLTLAAGQRIYLNASNSDNFANPASTQPGSSWLTFNPLTGKVELAVRGAPAIQASADGLDGNFLKPVSNVYNRSGSIAVTDKLAIVEADLFVELVLDSGIVDGHDMIIKRLGFGSVKIRLSLDGDERAEVRLDSPTLKEAVRLIWSEKKRSWLLIHYMNLPMKEGFIANQQTGRDGVT